MKKIFLCLFVFFVANVRAQEIYIPRQEKPANSWKERVVYEELSKRLTKGLEVLTNLDGTEREKPFSPTYNYINYSLRDGLQRHLASCFQKDFSVVFVATIGKTGEITDCQLEKTTGSAELDKKIMEAIKNYKTHSFPKELNKENITFRMFHTQEVKKVQYEKKDGDSTFKTKYYKLLEK